MSVDNATPPEWLIKLESRREKVKRKLGHETGAGAPCNVCKEDCPGLDLHFWRKVCRNCKCRKEQHNCPDEDDNIGWAQFEILGQIRSKPAFINISQLAKPIKLDWVPPDVDIQLASDYMKELGTNHIPISGSDAAAKRKQQLEYQVPPHDLDATLCHNLSENETKQLHLYVDKIRDDCVGQGTVIRFTDDSSTNDTFKDLSLNSSDSDLPTPPSPSSLLSASPPAPPLPSSSPPSLPLSASDLTKNFTSLPIGSISRDPILNYVLHSEPVQNILKPQISTGYIGKRVVHSSSIVSPNNNTSNILSQTSAGVGANDNNNSSDDKIQLPEYPDFMLSPKLSGETKSKLNKMKINTQTIHSCVLNGPFYDEILNKINKTDDKLITNDPLLKSINDFRNEYNSNDPFRNELNDFIDHNIKNNPELNTVNNDNNNKFLPKTNDFHSPLPQRTIVTKEGNLKNQETPMRRINFNQINYDNNPIADNLLTKPLTDIRIIRDPFLMTILNSDKIQNALNAQKSRQLSQLHQQPPSLILSTKSMLPDFDVINNNTNNQNKNNQSNSINIENFISPEMNDKLRNMKINQTAVQSVVLNEPIYAKLFSKLDQHNQKINQCCLLNPLQTFHREYVNNPQFKEDVNNYIDNIIENEEQPSPLLSDDPYYVPIYADVRTDHMTPHMENERGSVNAAASSMICKECKKNFITGEVAVKASRAGADVAWHPKCFVCNKCGELLADLVYFYHMDNIYCGRDLAHILKIPRCKACDELIFTKEYTAAENATFHIKHFCCYQCDRPLAGEKYIPDEKTNMPLCLKCYDEFHANECQRCRILIGPAEQGVSIDKLHWHSKCFSCSGIDCNKLLIGAKFKVIDKLLFCSVKCVQSIHH